jgi:hypothetical protein
MFMYFENVNFSRFSHYSRLKPVFPNPMDFFEFLGFFPNPVWVKSFQKALKIQQNS